MEQFIGTPLTLWEGDRNMKLMEDFGFTDSSGKTWLAPKGSFLNGATIPKPLWSIVGCPYVGPYRYASIVHDYFVGEGTNPEPISYEERRAADRMFYEACIYGGCTKRFAGILYIGVTIGSWASKSKSILKGYQMKAFDNIETIPEDVLIKLKFDQTILELDNQLDSISFQELEVRVHQII